MWKQAQVPGVGAVIAVASGKGGVGKSTTAFNMALALRDLGLRVGLLDADIYGPSMPRLTGIHEKPQLDEGRKIMPIERFGLAVMSIGFLVDERPPMIWRGPMVMSAITQMLRDVDWGDTRYPGGRHAARHRRRAAHARAAGAAARRSHRLDAAGLSLIEARRGLAMFQQGRGAGPRHRREHELLPVSRIAEPVPIFSVTAARGREAQKLGVPFLGEVPLHMDIRATSDAGIAVVSEPDGPHAALYRAIGAKVRDQLQGAIAAA